MPNAAKVLGGNACDSVFIDGDHVPEKVVEDLMHLANVSKANAVFIIDDCWTWERKGIWPAVERLVQAKLFDHARSPKDSENGFCTLRRSAS